MGTRADFYIKKNQQLEWLGSIAWDGMPDSIDKKVLKAKTEDEYLSSLKQFLSKRKDTTYPKYGWPWPWEDSNITDYAYIYDNGKVMASHFGSILFNPLKQEPNNPKGIKIDFPNMEKIQNVNWGERSGLIII